MTTPDKRADNLYALLIGSDCYLPNRLPNNCYYANLLGCVRDILRVEDFLRQRLKLSPERILKLTATNNGATKPAEPPAQWPTYENMVIAFRHLTDMAQPGDQVYIHYSGHGGRTPSLLPDIKKLDESLVPIDIGNSEARYLRDIELAKLLQVMVSKGLLVTIVLDSCHSGSATRGFGASVRGTDAIDVTSRPTDSLVATKAELTATWHDLTESRSRSLSGGSNWLPESNDYVLLAACRPSEAAYEFAFNGRESNGALTYWLLDSLQDIDPAFTYKQLHDRILAKVHSQFERQTPQLLGDGSRTVFGSSHVQPQYAALVMQVDAARRRLLLNAGQAQGVRQRAQFAIYPPTVKDFTQPTQRQALATVSEVGATASWAEYTPLNDRAITEGAQALLIAPGAINLIRKVRLLTTGLPTGSRHTTALNSLRDNIAASRWLELTRDEEPADYQLMINPADEYEILDRTGAPIRNLRPAINIDDADAAANVTQRLVHLTRYHITKQLDNNDPCSPLTRKLIVELIGMQRDYNPVDKPTPTPFASPNKTPTLHLDEWTFLRIKNESTQVLNVVGLDLQPDWGITQVYPHGQEWFMPFDPGQEEIIPLRANLPTGYRMGVDTIKVFATIGAANFHWLQLPPLDKPLDRKLTTTTRDGAYSALDQLLATIVAEYPSVRNLNPAAYPSQEWVMAQVEVCIERPDPDTCLSAQAADDLRRSPRSTTGE
jgi:Caspase domain